MNQVECLEDNFFTWTKDLNVEVAKVPTFKHAFTIALGLAMDALAITAFSKWTFNIHRSWTFPLAICAVYALKLFIQLNFFMAVP
jgi:hypothetical protein